MIVSAYKNQLDQIDLIEIASTFVDKHESRQFFYVVLISYKSKVYISQFFPLKLNLSLLHSVADIIIYTVKGRTMLSSMLNYFF